MIEIGKTMYLINMKYFRNSHFGKKKKVHVKVKY